MRRSLWTNVKKFAPKFSGSILDVGCGSKPYEGLFLNAKDYQGLEVDDNKCAANKTYDGISSYPFKDKEFDGVISFQALYQAKSLSSQLMEINRCLKMGGYILISNPFLWFDGMVTYENRYSDRFLREAFNESGFEIESKIELVCNISAVLVLMNCIFVSWISKKYAVIRYLSKPVIALLNCLIYLCNRIPGKTGSLYIDSIIYAKKIK